MSGQAPSAHLVRAALEVRVTGTEKVVLLALAIDATHDPQAESRLSLANLAHLCCIGQRTAIEAMRGLEHGEHVTRYRSPGMKAITKVHPRAASDA